jgi:hypothetical protein
MYRRQLTPIFVLILMIAAVEFVLSCGGGNGTNCGTYNQFGQFVPGPCSTPVPPIGYHLTAINICLGSPPVPTPTPSPSASPSKKPTPTLTPTPCPTSTTVTLPNTVQFNAIGTFQKAKKTKFNDVTNSSNWFSDNADVSYSGNGQFASVNAGCSCVYASSGGVLSLPMSISVASSAGPQPECSPCPTIAASATPTSTASVAATDLRSSNAMVPAGVLEWRVDAGGAVAGRIAIGPDGRIAFISADRMLHVVNSTGKEMFSRPAIGDAAVISSDGAIYAEGPAGGLMQYKSDGSTGWFAPA